MNESKARKVAEDLVEILVRGDVDVMTTKYQVSVKLARERILSEPYRNRERAEEVKKECINTLTKRFHLKAMFSEISHEEAFEILQNGF